MASFYCGSVREFLADDVEHVLARLAVGYANRGFTLQYADQTLTWQRDLNHLRKCLEECVGRSPSAGHWGLLLEFSIPRKELRIDIILLVRSAVIVIEAKTGTVGSNAKGQIEEYAILLHYFHSATTSRRVIPVIVSGEAVGSTPSSPNWISSYPQEASYWVASAVRSSWERLSELLLVAEEQEAGQISAQDWNDSPYHPEPSIVEAALALRSGLAVREIAQSEASEHEIENVRQTIQGFVNLAREQNKHAICFLTGVPGSGKTLVGLGLAHSEENKATPIHFMSGNGPLVAVLQHLFT